MTDVSCRIVLDKIEFMERRGLSVDELLNRVRAEIGVSAETEKSFLHNPNNWISWRTFAAMCRQWDILFSDQLLEAFQEEAITKPYWFSAVIKSVLNVISTPSQLFWLICKWAGPYNFPNLKATYDKKLDGRVVINLQIREGDEPAAYFFRMTTTMLAKMPRLIGYPDAVIEAEVTDRNGSFTILTPNPLSMRARLVRRLRALYAAPLLIAELAQRDAQLRSSYLRLVQARGELEAKVRDRTRELERANLELSTQIEALKRAERVAHIGSWEFNVATHELTWSDETYRICGMTRTDQPMTPELFESRMHPEDVASVRLAYQRAMETGEVFAQEHRIIWPNGEIRYVMERGEAVFDATGKPIKSLGTVHDITLQKKYEATLIEAKNAADEASHAKTRFLANMSHEIRTPMSSILGFAELLDDSELPAPRRQSYLEKILRNGRHLLALIDDALDLAKVEAGHLVVQPSSCSPSTELTSAVDLLRPQAEAKGLLLRLDLADSLPATMMTDQVRLRQILINVIGNAIKFTSKGRVHVRAYAKDDDMIVTVEDTGGGVAVENEPLLFKPFSQLPGAPRHSGSGLGLALARRLARALGGDVVLSSSRIGLGSTFTVTVGLHLPIETAPRALTASGTTTPSTREHTRPELEGMRILVAEDTQDIQDLLRRVLEANGARVTIAADGVECLDHAAASEFDLVLLDMHMPRIDGFETVATLRRRGFKKPVVALTAYAMVDERKRSYEAGCDDFLAKPVETMTLLATIMKWRDHPRGVGATISPE